MLSSRHPHPSTPSLNRLLAAGLVALATLPLASVVQAAPRLRSHGTTVTGPEGNTASRMVQRQGGQVDATTTGFRGRAFTRQAQHSATGSSSTITGANGQTASREVSRGDGQVNGTVTGPNGQSATRDVTRDASGATATLTGANGQTYSRTTTRADGTGSTTVTGPNGQTGTVTTTHQP